VAREFETKTGVKLAGNLRALRRLRAQCEAAKVHLSRNMTAQVQADALAEGVDFSVAVTRSRFETLCAPLLERCAAVAHHVMESCDVTADQVDEVRASTLQLRRRVLTAAARAGDRVRRCVAHPAPAAAGGRRCGPRARDLCAGPRRADRVRRRCARLAAVQGRTSARPPRAAGRRD
jgi:hypothetical protein